MESKSAPRPLSTILIAALVCLAAAGVLVAVQAEEPSTDATIGESPGYEDAGRTADTAPFALAEADGTSSESTIPEDRWLQPPTTAAPPTTTTSTRPFVTVDPADKACLAVKTFAEGLRGLSTMSGSPQVVAAAFSLSLADAATILREDPAARYSDTADQFDLAVARLNAATDYDAVRAAVEPLLSINAPVESPSTAAVLDHVRASCPALLP